MNRRTIGSGLALLYLVLATFPRHLFGVYRPGVDNSWVWAINLWPYAEEMRTRGAGFTYGPLGYLIYPREIGTNIVQAWCFQLGVQLLFAICVLALFRKAERLENALLCAGGYVLAFSLQLPLEHHVLLVIAMLLLLSLEPSRFAGAGAAVAGILATICLFAKFATGVTAFTLIAATVLLRWPRRTLRDWMPALVLAVSVLGSAILILSLSFGSLESVRVWLTVSREIPSAYATAMSYPAKWPLRYVALAALGVYGLLLMVLVWLRSPSRLPALMLLVAVGIAYRHGVVREATHPLNFFPFVLAVIAIALCVAKTRRETLVCAVAYALCLPLGLASLQAVYPLKPAVIARDLSAMGGWGQLNNLIRAPAIRAALREEGERRIAVDRLPDAWTAMMKAPGATVDVVPIELIAILANGLSYSHNPVLQTYAAFTPRLDELSAAHYSAPDGPGYVVLFLKTIDYRHPLMDAPATARELLRNYEVVDHLTRPPRLLLRRRTPRFGSAMSQVGETRARIGEWIEPPSNGRRLFAGLDMQLSLRGRMKTWITYVPPVLIELDYGGGRKLVRRLIVDSAPGGIMMDLPPDLPAASQLFSDSPARLRVHRFRVGGAGARSYRPEIRVRWMVPGG